MRPDIRSGHSEGTPYRESPPPKEASLTAQWRKLRADSRNLNERLNNQFSQRGRLRRMLHRDEPPLLPILDETAELITRYKQFAEKLTNDPDAITDQKQIYRQVILQPLVGKLASEAHTEEAVIEEAIDQIVFQNGKFQLLRDLGVKSYPYSEFYDLNGNESYKPKSDVIKGIVDYFANEDLESIKNSLKTNYGKKQQTAINAFFKDNLPPSFPTISNQDVIVRELRFNRWWHALKNSPQFLEIFGGAEISAIDQQVYRGVLATSVIDNMDRTPSIDILQYYPTTEAVKSLVFSASTTSTGYNLVRYRDVAIEILTKLARRADWKDIVQKTQRDYPDLVDDFTLLRDWVTIDTTKKHVLIQNAAANFTVSSIREEEAKGDRQDKKALEALYESLPEEKIILLLEEKGMIPGELAQTFLQAVTLLRTASGADNPTNTAISDFPFRSFLKQNLLRLRRLRLLNKRSKQTVNETLKHFGKLAEHIISHKDAPLELDYLAAEETINCFKLPRLQEFILLLPVHAPLLLGETMKAARKFVFDSNNRHLLQEPTDLSRIQKLLSDSGKLTKNVQSNGFEVLIGYNKYLLDQHARGNGDTNAIFDSYANQLQSLVNNSSLTSSLLTLMEPGGPLHTNTEAVFTSIYSSDNLIRRAQEIVDIFTKRIPYWKQLFLFTETRLGKELATADSEYPVDFFPRIKQVKGERVDFTDDFEFSIRPISRMSVREKKTLADFGDLNDEEIAALTHIPFKDFHGEYKKIIFAYLLSQTIDRSRNDTSKQTADQRNRALEQGNLKLTPGMYIHGSSIDFLDNILLNGNLPGEALGETAKKDYYPFHVDFSRITEDDLMRYPPTSNYLINSLAVKYGMEGKFAEDGQIFLLYDRSHSSWLPQEHSAFDRDNFSIREDHALVLGGMPATEISGIILRSPETSLLSAIMTITENGFYIPIYDMDGNLLFDPQEYDEVREDFNLQVPVDIWDYSFKTGEKKGSNPGGTYVVPTVEGPKSHYVKFTTEDHIWNELLADNLYRRYGLPVPSTKAVKTEGSYGHASEIVIQDDEKAEEALKHGFLMDAFIANWDAVMPENTFSSNGVLLRSDNGGALLSRARGKAKFFGSRVIELETMRAAYPGLTQDDIQYQLQQFRNVMTDETIDEEVDRVRLRKIHRDQLKRTLKLRRDYILSYDFERPSEEENSILTSEGSSFLAYLFAETIPDKEMIELVPDWERLISENGYQHNKVLLGNHINQAIQAVKELPEYQSLTENEQILALTALFFHDFGKPTGRQDEEVRRNFNHEVPSAQLANNYMAFFGFSSQDRKIVQNVILHDGIVSDFARGKPRKNLSLDELRHEMGSISAINILRVVNAADVIATVGQSGFDAIKERFNGVFDTMIAVT